MKPSRMCTGAQRVRGVLPILGLLVTVLPLPGQAQTFSKTERFEYHDNKSLWVMDQVKKVTCVSSTQARCADTVTTELTYDSATAQQLTYEAFGKLLQTLTYHASGLVASVEDGNGQITGLTSWYRGVPRTITYPDDTTQKAVVNGQGWITAVTDENNYRTCYAYDAMGRLEKTTYPSESAADTCDTTTWNPTNRSFAKITTAEYGIAAGHWRQTVQTGNGYRITYFDGQWRPLLVQEYDASNIVGTQRFQRFGYDHEGRSTFESYHGTTDNLTTGTRLTYDSLGRVAQQLVDSELGTLTTTTEYLSGFKTRVTDPRNEPTTTSFLAYDEPVADLPLAIELPEAAYMDFTRDAYGKALTIVRRNADSSLAVTRTYYYNTKEELCRVVDPETGGTLTGYDGAGNVKWTAAGLASNQSCDPSGTSAGVAPRRVDRTYDSRNRLLTLRFPDGKGDQTWTYRPDGKPLTVNVVNPNATADTLTDFLYFRRGLPKRERVFIHPTNFTTTWAYDANGHLSQQTYHSGLDVDFAPNALGQATQAGTYATGVTYHPNGAIKSFAYGNGVLHTTTQNARQLTSRSTDCKVSGTCSVANMRLDLSYAYDEAGNVTAITDGEGGRQTRGMTYDGLNRLKTVSSQMFGAASYTYNRIDDLTQITVAGGSQPRTHYLCFSATTRRVTAVRTAPCSEGTPNVMTLAYDVQGNLSARGSQAYVFDHGNRLREVTGLEWYAYDGFGHRVLSCNASDCAKQVYSSRGRLEFVYDARNDRRVDYIYLGTRLVAQRQRPVGSETVTVKYQHTDGLGTPTAVTDAGKNFLSKHEYEPYGLLVNGTLQDGPGFTGHVQDAATGMTYMQQRYYDPIAGRFLSVDPVTTDAKTGRSFNRYAYVENNPYKHIDPDGRDMVTLGVNVRVPFVGGATFSVGVSYEKGKLDGGIVVQSDGPVPSGGKMIGKAAVELGYQKGDFASNKGELSKSVQVGAGKVGASVQQDTKGNVTGGAVSVGPQLGAQVSYQQTATLSIRNDIAPAVEKVGNATGKAVDSVKEALK